MVAGEGCTRWSGRRSLRGPELLENRVTVSAGLSGGPDRGPCLLRAQNWSGRRWRSSSEEMCGHRPAGLLHPLALLRILNDRTDTARHAANPASLEPPCRHLLSAPGNSRPRALSGGAAAGLAGPRRVGFASSCRPAAAERRRLLDCRPAAAACSTAAAAAARLPPPAAPDVLPSAFRTLEHEAGQGFQRHGARGAGQDAEPAGGRAPRAGRLRRGYARGGRGAQLVPGNCVQRGGCGTPGVS